MPGHDACKQPSMCGSKPLLHLSTNYAQSSHACAVSIELCMQNAEGRVYLEYGAGKGYLSSMLADASKARDFVLLDVRGFRNKADRCSFAHIIAIFLCPASVQASHEPCVGLATSAPHLCP